MFVHSVITVVAKSLGPPLKILIQATNTIFTRYYAQQLCVLCEYSKQQIILNINHACLNENFPKRQYFVGPPLDLITSSK